MAWDARGDINLAAIQPRCEVDGDIYSLVNASQARGASEVRLLESNGAPDYRIKSVNKRCLSRMDGLAYHLMGGAFTKFLNGTCTWEDPSGVEIACGDRWWLAPFWEEKRASVQSITNHFETMANATTNHIRLGFLRNPVQPDGAKGWALRQVPYTHIEWSWLILPAALLVIDIITLVYTVLRSVRHRDTEAVWKSNPLPLLYYKSRFVRPGEPETSLTPTGFGPLEGASSEDDRLLTSAELGSFAKNAMVQFRKGDRKAVGADDKGEQTGEDTQPLAEAPVRERLSGDYRLSQIGR
ncbi:hypothetical protein PG984_010165 [Apiospora sp. TS-2023a]